MNDLRFALRQWRQHPGFTLVAVITLALGIGANSAMFNLVNTLVLKPLAVQDPQRLVAVYSRDTERPDQYRSFSFPNYLDLRKDADVFADVLGQMPSVVGLGEGESTRRTMAMLVTANYFSTLGVPLAQGRGFLPEEETRPIPVVVVSHGYWKKQGSDPALVGKTVRINSLLCTVVGITPEGFTGTMAMVAPEVLLPFGLHSQLANGFLGGTGDALSDRGRGALMPVARLKPGVTVEAANARLAVLSDQLARAYPKENEHQQWLAAPMPRLAIADRPQRDAGRLATLGVLLLGMSCVVLLIACLNLANMMLARGAARRKEIAVRLALGAARGRVFRQLLVEALLLSLLGGVFGLLLAGGGARVVLDSLQRLAPVMLVFQSTLDPAVLLATFAFCVLATVFFALGPAWRLSGVDVNEDLKEHGGGDAGRGRLLAPRNLLAIGQVALSLALLVAAGLFTRSAINAFHGDPGFSLDRGLVFQTDAQMAGLDEVQGRAAFQALVDRVRAVPGVASASLATTVPFGDVQLGRSVQRAGAPRVPSQADASPAEGRAFNSGFNAVGDDYFVTLGVNRLRGREFSRAEVHGTNAPRVAIINQELAAALWPGEDAVGRHIQFTSDDGTGPGGGGVGIRGNGSNEDSTSSAMEVVGVVPTLKNDLFDPEDRYRVYVPIGQSYQAAMHLHVLPAPGVPVAALQTTLREEIQRVDSRLPQLALHSLRSHFERNGPLWMVRTGAMLFGVFAGVALLLSVIGVYGLRAYAVACRTREIGIRMALGAGRTEVLRWVMADGLRLSLLGLGVGLILAVGVSMAIRGFLYEVPRYDPVVFLVAPLVLLTASLLACWIPARRAARVDPMVALRTP